MRRAVYPLLLFFVAALLLCGCDATRFLGEDETILRKVKVESSSKAINASDYRQYVRQEANSRWFSLVKVPLGLYCFSPSDTTQRKGRFWRRIGEAPVVYDTTKTEYSRRALQSALMSKGFLHASVVADTVEKDRRTDVTYRLTPGPRYYVRSFRNVYDSELMQQEVASLPTGSLLREGQPLDIATLAGERNRVVSGLQDKGYYKLNKEFVRFSVDTLIGSQAVDVTQVFAIPTGADSAAAYRAYRYGEVLIEEERGDEERQTALVLKPTKTGNPRDGEVVGAHYAIRPNVYLNHVRLRPDSLFSETYYAQTHSALGSLPIVNSASVRLTPSPADSSRLDALVTVHLSKPHAVSAELEGTNTNGDLGAAVVLGYQNRNIFHGAELFSLKLRGAYEAITGLEGYNGKHFFEYSAEASLRFPSSRLPFAPMSSRRFTRSTSEMRLLYDSQNRPEFHRRSLSATWAYRWTDFRHPDQRHYFDLLGITYVFMPWISDTFREQYLEGQDSRYSILRSSYEDLFIMNTSYTFVLGNGTGRNVPLRLRPGAEREHMWQLKLSGEIAGNLLYGFSALTHAPKNEAGQYKLFGIAFSQYAKIEADYSRLMRIDKRNTLAFHAFFGLALPYGNATTIPYEKRYFSGGANSVRGWGVRELGPGSYTGQDGKVDFINQTGNLKLDFSVEWRTDLFWKLGGALFVDAGNVWNTRSYVGQEAGTFHFKNFWKQIAVAYGIGLRLQFDYFTLRLDGGMKAVNPVYENSRQHFPIFHPVFSRDFALHFAVGLPF